MTIRRQRLIAVALFLFLMWNLAAYLMFTRPAEFTNKNDPQVLESPKNLSERLTRLQKQMQDQREINEELLREIVLQKEKFLQNSKKLSPGKNIGGVDLSSNQRQAVPDREYPFQLQLSKDVKYPFSSYIIPVLVIACNRPAAVTRSLTNLIEMRPSSNQFPIIVSQDCGHEPTASAIKAFGSKITHIRQPDLSSIALPTAQRKFEGYYKIARHYKWALNQIFHQFNYGTVIIVEDDLDVSVDFFEYFLATYPLLHEDPTLWCVSAWNDNGKESRISQHADLLYRSDFFPGLGWMLRKDTWTELQPKWPAG